MIYNFASASKPTTFVLEIIEEGVVKRHFLPACYLAANGGTLSGGGIVVAPERLLDRTLPVFNILNTDKVYINGVSGGGISETIQQLNAIIYRAPNSGGIQVGPHLTFEDGVLDYLLPTASATTKGGIKVGPTLWIDPDTAILNIVMAQKYDPADPDYDPENPPPLGGVIVGDGLSIDERGILSNDNPTDYFRPIQELAGIEFDFVRVVDDLSTVTWYTPSDPPTIEDHEPLSNNVPVVGKVAIYNKADVTEDPETGEKSGARVYAYEDGAPMVDEEGNDIIAGGDMIPGGGDELEDGDYVYVRHVDNPDDPDDKSGGLRAYYLLGVNEEFCDWEELGADLTYYATKVWTEWYVKDPRINIITRIDDGSSVQDEVNADDGVRELYSEALHDNGFSHGHFTLNQPEDEDTYDIYVPIPRAKDEELGLVRVEETRAATDTRGQIYLDPSTAEISVYKATAGGLLGVVKVTDTRLATDTVGQINLATDGTISVPIANNTLLGVVKVPAFATSHLEISSEGAVSVPIAQNTVVGVVSVDVFANSHLNLNTTTGALSVPIATNSQVGVVKVPAFATSNLNLSADGAVSVPIAGNTTLGVVKVDTFANSNLNLDTTTGAVSVPIAGNTSLGVVKVDTFATSRLTLDTTTGDLSVPLAGNTTVGVVSVDTFANSRLNLDTLTGELSVPIAGNTSLGVVQVDTFANSRLNLNTTTGAVSVPLAGNTTVGVVSVDTFANSRLNLNTTTGAVSVPIAGNTTLGVVSVDTFANSRLNLNTTTGAVSVPIATNTALGVVKVPVYSTSKLNLNASGEISVNLATKSNLATPYYGVMQAGSSLKVDPAGVVGLAVDESISNTATIINDKLFVYGGESRVLVALSYRGDDTESTLISVDGGVTWEIATLPAAGRWHHVEHGDGKFVAVAESNGILAVCLDGDTQWTSVPLRTAAGAAITGFFMEIRYFNGAWVLVDYGYGSNPSHIWISTNDLTYFTELTFNVPAGAPSPSTVHWRSVHYGMKTMVGVSFGQWAFYKDDTMSVAQMVQLPSNGSWIFLSYGTGVFVCPGQNNNKAIWSSDKGRTWNESTLPGTANWKWSAYGGGKFVVVAQGQNRAAYGTPTYGSSGQVNGITWAWSNVINYEGTAPSSNTWQCVAYSLGKFIAISQSSCYVTYSSDGGQNWSAAKLANTSTAVTAIEWASFAVGNLNTIADFPDLTFTQDTDEIAEIDAVSALAVGDVVRRIQFKQVNSDYPGPLGGTSLNFSFGSSGGTCAIRYNSGSGGGIEYTSTESGVTETQVIQFSSSGRTYTTDFEFRGGALWNAETHTLTFGEPRTLTAKGTGTNGPGPTADAPWYSFEIITATNSVTYNLNTIFELLGNYYDKFETDAVFKSLLELQTNAVATTSSLGIVQIGANINVTSGGIISVPTATATTLGVVKVPSTSNLTLSAGDLNVPIATASVLGVVKVAARATSNLSLAADGFLSAPQATDTQLGVVMGGEEGISIDATTAAVTLEPAVGIIMQTATLPSGYWRSVTFAKGMFVAAANSATAYSTDGINWTSGTGTGFTAAMVCGGEDGFICYNSQSGTFGIKYSSDGITWADSTNAPFSSGTMSCAAYGAGKWVILNGGSNVVAYSSNGGQSWTTGTMPSSNWSRVAYGNGKFIAIASGSNKTAVSTDGVTWTSGANLTSSSSWVGIAYGNGRWVASAGSSAVMCYSTNNGTSWTAGAMPSSRNWVDITFANGIFVAVCHSDATTAYSSAPTNAASWTTVTGTSLGGAHVAGGNGAFVVQGEGSTTIALGLGRLGGIRVGANLEISSNGTLSALPVETLEPATTTKLGGIIVGSNLSVTADGTLSVPLATTSVFGVVKVGTNIDVSSGTISVKTATASDLGVVKVGSNINVSSGTISVPVADATTLGVVKVQSFATSNLNLISGDLSVPKATTTSLGVVKVGDGIEVDSNGEISWAEEEYADDVAALAASQTYPHRLCWVAEVQ